LAVLEHEAAPPKPAFSFRHEMDGRLPEVGVRIDDRALVIT